MGSPLGLILYELFLGPEFLGTPPGGSLSSNTGLTVPLHV